MENLHASTSGEFRGYSGHRGSSVHLQSGGRTMSSVAANAQAAHKDYEGAKLRMWLFLFTEILLFGGLFILYSAYRSRYPMEFHEGGQHLNVVIGVANTFILLTSSLTVAVSIAAIQKGNRRLSILCLTGTILLGAAFLVD